jgi:hypothetical protein
MKMSTVVIQPTKHLLKTSDEADKRRHGDEEHDKQDGHNHHQNTAITPGKSFYVLYK